MSEIAYRLQSPKHVRSGVVFASPHSGTDYGTDFLQETILDPCQIRSSEDAFVDQLFHPVVDMGAALFCACAPRAYLDLNRDACELDPALIHGVGGVGKGRVNARITSGLGVIPRVVAGNRPIYRGKIPLQEAHRRLDAYWYPYHDRLQSLLDETRSVFGKTVLIDCHSMPHEAACFGCENLEKVPEIVLGDLFGATASRSIFHQVECAFQDAGFRVSRNAPFAGAYIAKRYGKPSKNQHVVQIEIDRSLYMDETMITPLPSFLDFQNRLRPVLADVCAIVAADVTLAAQ